MLKREFYIAFPDFFGIDHTHRKKGKKEKDSTKKKKKKKNYLQYLKSFLNEVFKLFLKFSRD